jgi:hypothetical protein
VAEISSKVISTEREQAPQWGVATIEVAEREEINSEKERIAIWQV